VYFSLGFWRSQIAISRFEPASNLSAPPCLPEIQEYTIDPYPFRDTSGGESTKAANPPPRDPKSGSKPRAIADFGAQVAQINVLIEAGRLDEAIAAVDELRKETGGETRAKLAEERERLRKSAARKRERRQAVTPVP
jgi:hypothetical protein